MNGVPALGFYGHFEPAIQPYSCAASPFWMFLSYSAAMSLPADSPFWTAVENEGFWTENEDQPLVEQYLTGPGFHVHADRSTGTAELKPGKVPSHDPNYSRMVYNTHFPWEDDEPKGGTPQTFSIQKINRDGTKEP